MDDFTAFVVGKPLVPRPVRGFSNMKQLNGSLLDYLSPTHFSHDRNPGIDDGDTLNMNGKKERYRFFGIDAPETTHKFGGVDQYGGQAATQHLRDLIGDSGVSAYFDHNDKYGRRLAYLMNGNLTRPLNELMVKDGYAIPFMSREYNQYKNNYRFGTETPYEFRVRTKKQGGS